MTTSEGPDIASFLATFCRHPRGNDAGKPVFLVPEQREVLEGIFAIDENTGLWKHREALVLVHRKWAKTLIMSGVGLHMLTTRPMGTEVYFVANSRQQAGILKKNVDAFALASAPIRKRVYVYRNRIETPFGSHIMVLGADAHQAHGYNPSLSVVDEYWAFKHNDLPEALASGAAAREESLTIYITTPGINMDSPLGRLLERSRRGDPTLYVHWHGEHVRPDVDIFDREVWREFNIGFRHGWISDQFMLSQATALSKSEFVRLHLGGWLQQSSGWMDMYVWDSLKRDRLLQGGERVVLFIDGAWKHDSVAIVACTTGPDPQLQVLKTWEKPLKDESWRVPYSEIDAAMRHALTWLNVAQIGADPFFLSQLMQQWDEDGIPVVEVPTNSLPRAVAACKRFMDAVAEKRLHHEGSQILRRHIQNCVPKIDGRGLRVTADRANPLAKIDCAVAAIHAYDLASKMDVEAKVWMY